MPKNKERRMTHAQLIWCSLLIFTAADVKRLYGIPEADFKKNVRDGIFHVVTTDDGERWVNRSEIQAEIDHQRHWITHAVRLSSHDPLTCYYCGYAAPPHKIGK